MNIVNPLSQSAPLLAQGKVGIIPTDTVYGLVALARNTAAVTRLYALKHREHKPGTVIAANVDQLVEMGIPRKYLKPVEGFWPNSISVVVPAPASLSYLHQEKGSLAVRVPADEHIRDLLLQTGPLLTSSANHAGHPVATTITEAQNYFNENVDFYVDGGDSYGAASSTIIRVVDDAIEIIRAGAVTINESGEIA